MGWVTYILELADDCWYVGRTVDTHRRFRQHFTGRGAKWLQLHPPKRLKEVWQGDREKEITLQLMRRHGIERVRGGPWCSTRSTPHPAELLLEEIMSATQIADASTRDWHIGQPTRNTYGALSWAITSSKDSKTAPRVQLAQDGMTLRCPFGVSTYAGESTGRQNLDYAIPAWLGDLKSFLQSVDKFVLEYVWEHKLEFFPKKPPSTKETLLDWYHPLLAPGKENYDPTMRTKVSASTPVFICSEFAGEPSKKGTLADVLPGSTCCPLVTFSKIWVMGGNKFGVTCITSALLLWPRAEKGIEDFGFVTAHTMPRSQTEPDAPE